MNARKTFCSYIVRLTGFPFTLQGKRLCQTLLDAILAMDQRPVIARMRSHIRDVASRISFTLFLSFSLSLAPMYSAVFSFI